MKPVIPTSRRLWLCILALMPAQAFAFGIDDLIAMIRDGEPDTVEEVIGQLPTEYKENYTLAYDSQSLQGSSYDNPRAILFGHNARFVLTFNGDPSQKHYHAIEAMQFREDSESFELYSLDFSGEAVRVSGPNPEVCEGCHGSPPHPIWSSYEYGERDTNHWPGFYGSTHDAPINDARERDAFRRFQENAPSHPRYRHLVLSKPDADWFPYAGAPTYHYLRPNNRLGNLLARWHARQIVARINREDFIHRHPAVAQAWLLQCPGTEEKSYKQRVRTLFDARYPPEAHSLVHALLDKLSGSRQISFMMERLLTGSSSFGWDMTVEAPEVSGRFYTGIVTIDDLVGARWMAVLDPDHWLKNYYKPRGARELYNTFAEGYYESNVQPGGAGKAYDSVIGYYDKNRAHLACPGIIRSALEDLHAAAQ